MAISVDVKISIDGKLLPDYHSLSIQQELFTHHSFKVTVPYEVLDSGRNGFIYQAHKQYCGKAIRIEVTEKVWKNQKGYLPLQFEGIITNIALANFNSTDNSIDFNHRFVLSGYSPTYVLEGGSQRRTFRNKDLKSIFKEVLEPYPNEFDRELLAPQHQEPVEYAVQYDESPYAFLRRLADEYGEWFYYDGQQLRLGLPSAQGPLNEPALNEPPLKESLLEFKVGATQLFDMAIDLKPSKFRLNHYNYLTSRRPDKSLSENQPLTQLNSFTRFALKESDNLFAEAHLSSNRHVRDQNELNTATREKKESWASRLVTFKGKGENPGFAVGKQVSVRGSRQESEILHDYGRYRVTKVKHMVEGDQYKNKFEALPAAAKHPPANPWVQPPQGVPELARVISLNDPEKLGRIQLRYLWPVDQGNQSDSETNWVRVSTPYAGKGHGQLFIPEEESEVLVGYEQGRPEFPVVLGNLFYRKNEQNVKEYTSPQNHIKSIQTAGGNTITFGDEPGDEHIKISNGKEDTDFAELEVSFADGGSIILYTAGTIKLEANLVFLSAQEVEVDAEKSIKFTTRGSIRFDADQQITLTGANVAINGANVAMNGANTAKLKGAATEVAGTNTTIIKAPLVKIN